MVTLNKHKYIGDYFISAYAEQGWKARVCVYGKGNKIIYDNLFEDIMLANQDFCDVCAKVSKGEIQ